MYRLKDVLYPSTNRRNRLSRLMDRVANEQNTLEIVRSQLPPREAAHCIGASVKGSTLVILADSASWASRLRFQSKNLVEGLHHVEQFAKVQKAIVQTNATAARTTPKH